MFVTESAIRIVGNDWKDLNLALQSVWLTGRVTALGARLLVRHEFQTKGRKPDEVIYSFPLPRDATMRRFRIQTEENAVESRLEPREEEAQRYEAGIAAGHLSALARIYGDGLVNLSVGNVRPGELVVVELEILAGVEPQNNQVRFRFPFTLAPSYHSKATVISPAPGWSELQLPPLQFGDLLLPEWTTDSRALHRVGFDLAIELEGTGARVGSPSHRIQVEQGRVALATAADLPNRDLVLDLETSALPEVVAGPALDGRRHFAAKIPATEFGQPGEAPRKIIFVIDRSGSMHGAPWEQAKSAALACLATLAAEDEFGVMVFNEQPDLWESNLRPATKQNRDSAGRFLNKCSAAGGTELARALTAAATHLGAEGEVFLITDGQVFAGEAIIEEALQSKLRVHVLGVGSASQDRFLSQLARQTGGISRFVTIEERVDKAALELFNAIGCPVAEPVEMSVPGEVLVAPASSVYAGTPLLAMGWLSEDVPEPRVEIRWGETDPHQRSYPISGCDADTAETLRLLEGARRITDMDQTLVEGSESRTNSRVRQALRALSEEYGLASREMSLVAVMHRRGDVSGRLPHTLVVPVGVSSENRIQLLLSAMPAAAMSADALPDLAAPGLVAPLAAMKNNRRPATQDKRGLIDRLLRRPSPLSPAAPIIDSSFELAAMLEDDGGMPGTDPRQRIRRSLAALEVLRQAGAEFGKHVKRLRAFLESQPLDEQETEKLRQMDAGVFEHSEWERLAQQLVAGKI